MEEARGRLDTIHQNDSATYLALLTRLKPVTTDDGLSYLIARAPDFTSILSAPGWITGVVVASRPGKLCKLTSGQKKIPTNSTTLELAPGFQEPENLPARSAVPTSR